MQINKVTPNYITPKNNNLKNQNNLNPSFKGGVPQPIVNGLSSFYEKTVSTNGFQKFVKAFSNSNNTFTHLLVAESCFLSGFYMINTLRNKKIDKKQKPQMLINDTLTLGISTAGAYFADDKVSNVVSKLSEKYFEKNKDFYTKLGQEAQAKAQSTPIGDLLNKVGEVVGSGNVDKLKEGVDDVASMVGKHLKGIVGEEGHLKTFQMTGDKLSEMQNAVKEAVSNNVGNAEKAKEAVSGIVKDAYKSSAARNEAEKIMSGINKLKVLVIFGIIYRYIGPVVVTPIANKLSSKFFSNKQEKKSENTEGKK